jgi:hypothetical protein
MGFTSMVFRSWMRQRRQRALAEDMPATPTISIEDFPAPGARWRRSPDGSWMRWSYLGNEWEPNEAPQPLVEAASAKLAENEWMLGPGGVWEPVKPEATAAKEAEPGEQPSLDLANRPTTDQPRPEWKTDLEPEWKEPFN